MNKALPLILLLSIITPLSHSLFSQNPSINITLKTTSHNKIVLQTSGSKFLTWNANSQIVLYNIQGSPICNMTYPQQIQKIIWPTEYYPIILPFPGLQISTLNFTSCEIIKDITLIAMTNVTNTTDEIYDINFIWRNGGPFVALSSWICIWQIDLSSVSMINFYATMDSSLPKFQSIIYSRDDKYIYVVMTDNNSGARTIRVWQRKTVSGKPIREIPFTTSVSALALSNDNSTIICVGSSMTEDTTTVYRFDDNGFVKSKATKSGIIKAISIGNGNTVALFQTSNGNMQLVRAGDGKNIQNITYSSSNYLLDADFQNKVLIILDSSSRILSYAYTPDEDVQPIPDPVDPAKSFPIWIIILSVVGGILILAVVLMYFFQEKLPEKFRKKLPNCFNKEKIPGKQPLIQERNSVVESIESNQTNPRLGPNNLDSSLPSNQYQNYQNPPPHDHNDPFQQGPIFKDGIPEGLNDAEIIQANKKEQERKRLFEQRRRRQILQRQEKQRKYRLEQEERKKKQDERRQKDWNQQQILMEIERRKKEQYERERIRREQFERQRIRRQEYDRERIRREQIERIRRQEETKRYYEYQRMEEERRKDEIRRIEYQRFLEEQERRKYQQPPYQPQPQPSYQPQPPYQPQPQYVSSPSNPNFYVIPPPMSNPNVYVPPLHPYNDPIYVPPKKEPELQPQPQQKSFAQQRKNLWSNANKQEKPVMQEDDEDIPMTKSFFVVKKKGDDRGVDSEVKGDEENNHIQE